MHGHDAWIVGIGHHVPRWRLTAADGSGRIGFPRAGADEDAVTMGVSAGKSALGGLQDEVRTLMFSTARPPYEAKSNATIVHEALRLARRCEAFDAVGPARSGIGALRMSALSDSLSLVVASDLNYGPPGSAQADGGGDGAAALLVASGRAVRENGLRGVARLLGSSSVNMDLLEHWRLPGEWWKRSWGEDRFAAKMLAESVEQALPQALESAGLTQQQVDRFVVVGTNRRAVSSVQRKLGAGAASLSASIGDAGSASWALSLVDAIEQAEESEVIGLICLEDGCEAVLVEKRSPASERGTLRASLEAPAQHATEFDYLVWRGAVQGPLSRRPEPVVPSLPGSARDSAWKFGGLRRTEQGSADVARGVGVIREWVADYLATAPEPPLITARVEYDGIDLQLDVVDADASRLDVGAEVEGAFRRRWSVEGIHNYVWKVRVREGWN